MALPVLVLHPVVLVRPMLSTSVEGEAAAVVPVTRLRVVQEAQVVRMEGEAVVVVRPTL